MLKEITAAIKAEKAAGAFKLRLVMLVNIDVLGREVPQVTQVAEFETGHILLKSGQVAGWLKNNINGDSRATYFRIERLK
jgi:hypothetical protein